MTDQQELSQEGLISVAQRYLRLLEEQEQFKLREDIPLLRKKILDKLAAAEKDEAALDPEGKATAGQMQERIAEAVKRAHLIYAQWRFKFFEKATQSQDGTDNDFFCPDTIERLVSYIKPVWPMPGQMKPLLIPRRQSNCRANAKTHC